ncbi:MAG: four helix bundle protein, partial [Ferruginibacter sp.]
KVQGSRFKVQGSRFKVQGFLIPKLPLMSTISKFEDLEIWQLARHQANSLFQIYSSGSFSKDYELRNQISRSSGSVMDNISEGFERGGNKEFINFLLIAKGSNGEVRSQLYRAADRKHIDDKSFSELINKCQQLSRQITALIKYLKTSDQKGFRYHNTDGPEQP